MNKLKTKERDTNFELLRIISMTMILVLHFNVGGEIMTYVHENSKTYYLVYFLEYACIIAVNIYVMITGYYMIKSKIKIKKILTLELTTVFYSVIIYLIITLCKQETFLMKTMMKKFFPIITREYWFITAYIGLYMLIPFINKLATMNQREYSLLLIILTTLLSVVRFIYPSNIIFEANGGYGLTWFIYLYLLGGYIRLYVNKIGQKYKMFILYIIVILVQIIIRKLNLPITQGYLNNSLSYNSIFILIESVIVFILFKNIEIKNRTINKIILTISPLTLGVYLIHEHSSFRNILWGSLLQPKLYLSSGWSLLAALIIDVFLIFSICCIIEKIRQLIFKLFSKTSIIKNIDTRINTFMVKTCNLDNKEI